MPFENNNRIQIRMDPARHAADRSFQNELERGSAADRLKKNSKRLPASSTRGARGARHQGAASERGGVRARGRYHSEIYIYIYIEDCERSVRDRVI